MEHFVIEQGIEIVEIHQIMSDEFYHVPKDAAIIQKVSFMSELTFYFATTVD